MTVLGKSMIEALNEAITMQKLMDENDRLREALKRLIEGAVYLYETDTPENSKGCWWLDEIRAATRALVTNSDR